jgi:hypothetical protein
VDPAAAQYGIGYGGPHPIPYQYGSGFCYIEGPHSHEYAPFDEHLFRESNGYYYFNGDPSDFGWNRSIYWFNGNHPVPLAYGGGYCYMSWPHRHFYDAAGIAGLSLVGGYYIYSGVWPSDYYRLRPFYWGYYGGYYRHNYFGNRYYTVRPPPIYRHAAPVRIGAPPGRIFRAGAAPAPAWRPAPRVIGAPAPGYRPAPAYGGGYHPAPAVGGGYHPAPAYGGGYHPAPAVGGGYHPAAPAPAYHPAYRPAPAPAFRAAPARGGFRR